MTCLFIRKDNVKDAKDIELSITKCVRSNFIIIKLKFISITRVIKEANFINSTQEFKYIVEKNQMKNKT